MTNNFSKRSKSSNRIRRKQPNQIIKEHPPLQNKELNKFLKRLNKKHCRALSNGRENSKKGVLRKRKK